MAKKKKKEADMEEESHQEMTSEMIPYESDKSVEPEPQEKQALESHNKFSKFKKPQGE